MIVSEDIWGRKPASLMENFKKALKNNPNMVENLKNNNCIHLYDKELEKRRDYYQKKKEKMGK